MPTDGPARDRRRVHNDMIPDHEPERRVWQDYLDNALGGYIVVLIRPVPWQSAQPLPWQVGHSRYLSPMRIPFRSREHNEGR